ncbi:transketolase family protein [Desulfovibrio inopinatus]|uniref:transketolase family protein n=1 Tax=Desulfovibrio inopinatus TaxID=102109 RepID=UPI0004217876|nr:transketolase C-terminal domain-containing protein [Desulfovibrio inopinatus]
MRKKCLNMVHELARKDQRVCFIGSDLGFKTLDTFRQEFPERFFMEGVSEANVVGMAAGLAMDGRVVYVNTIATFLTRRALDQVAIDLCQHKVNVRLIGNGGGLVYAPLGSTHLALEDITLMRCLPNMTVVCPCDADEMERFMLQTGDYSGPIYIRLGKGYDPIVSKEENGFTIGKGIAYRQGDDLLLVTTGVTLQQAVTAAEELEKDGISAGILHMHTVKPFDAELLIHMAASGKPIISIEEHTLNGGLGSAVAETLVDNFAGNRLLRLGIPDIFPDYYGSQNDLMHRLGIDAAGILQAAKRLLDR